MKKPNNKTSPTWKEYQEALKIVKQFESEGDEIRLKRSLSRLFKGHSKSVWLKRMEINDEEYSIRRLSKERREEIGEDFIKNILDDEKSELLKLRLKTKNLNKQQ